ncbi:MAG: (Fe-S)-binding protein [Longimicrobiales bacterium]
MNDESVPHVPHSPPFTTGGTSSFSVGLFIPCYIDQLFPRVAVATLELLERHGCTVAYPLDQTCCGQPLANAGFEKDAAKTMRLFVQNFQAYDYVVTPSASCALHVREHYASLEQSKAVQHVRTHTFELCEFLTDVLRVKSVDAAFPHRVGFHPGCHGLRGLRLGQASELNSPALVRGGHDGGAFSRDKVRALLERVRGLTLVDLDRADECCGFGGTFSVTEETVSVRMGRDRIDDHLLHGAEFMTSADMSCLMHMDGLARRAGLPIRVRHVAEILNGTAE